MFTRPGSLEHKLNVDIVKYVIITRTQEVLAHTHTYTHIHTLIHFYTKFVYIKDHKRVCKQIHTDGCSYDVCTIVQIHIKSKCACLLGGELVWGLVSVSFTRVFYTNNFNQIVISTHLCSPSVVMSSHVCVCVREREGWSLFVFIMFVVLNQEPTHPPPQTHPTFIA